MSIDVAVVGAGVSGLSVAYRLVRRGYRVTVLERQVHAGGNAVSQRFGGFLMEHGPSSVNGAAPVAVDLARALGLDTDRCELGAGVRYRYLVRDGGLHRIPIHAFGFLTSSYLSFGARVRVAVEALVPARRGPTDETVAGFWRRRFGAEFNDRVGDPLVAGLFAGRADELSMAAVFPALVEMERRYGSVTRGVLAKRIGHARMPGRRLFSWRDGIASLPHALAARLGPAVRTGIAVRRIGSGANGYRLDLGRDGILEAKAVVVATQPHVTAGLLDGLDGAAAEAAGEIDAPPLAVVFLGFERGAVAHPLDGLGYLTPEAERRPLTGALFCSTMFPGRAPEGHVALAGYIGGARAPELARLAATDLIALARDEFRDLLGARGEPVVARVRQWPRGLPQFRPGHAERTTAIRDASRRRPGLFVTGNYFAGASVAACMTQATATAARVSAYLGDTGSGSNAGSSTVAISGAMV
ncbi:MAG: protoporphyrinogen oxidase [Alphaproteobacteria bacterium]